MKRIIIVGGGYAGTVLARALDGVAEIHLIEPRDQFVHNVAAIRAVTDPSLLERMIIPYDRLLHRGKVIQEYATEIAEGRVTLGDGRIIEADYIVAATGSRYTSPFKASRSSEQFKYDVQAAHAQLAAARSVAVIGGGAVGVELAGEIAAAFRGKAIDLIASSPALVPGYSAKLSNALVQQLKAREVSLHLNAKVTGLNRADGPFSGPLNVDGRLMAADLVFAVVGATPQRPPIPGARVASNGRTEVDAWLRPAGHAQTYAIGDAAATGDPMTIVAITRQVPWLTKTLKALIASRPVEALAPYAPWPSGVLLVPLGPNAGASQLPFGCPTVTVGPRITSILKGRDLFITRYRKAFGYGRT